VRRALARSRGEARDLVLAGSVRVGGSTVTKPSHPVGDLDELTVATQGPRWVGRAAHKLVAALDTWAADGLSVTDRRCVDVGASTGGFTQVLLARGAARVVAVDVGRDQLVPEVAQDPRVVERSGTTVRGLTADDLGGVADLVVADLSFISLPLVMGDLAGLLGADADLVLLVKPQFEAGRQEAARGKGVITDPVIWRRVLEEVAAALDDLGTAIMGAMASPLTGADGNVEFLLHARTPPASAATEVATATLIDAALAEAETRR
jgi:23S rRNA (cytidine1920-2'-O)/16S rRNA (cytidine1409-2'-O)-methyltransferase